MIRRVVFLDRASLKATVRKPVGAGAYVEYEKTSLEEIVPRLAGADVAIVNKVPLRASTLERLPELKMIAVAATGYDVVDVAYCKAHGIAVANIRNYAVHTVPEHAFMLILALRRSLLAYREDVQNGAWNRSEQFCFFTHPVSDLHGSTLGIFGEGVIGQRVARLGEAFGMRALFAAHKNVQGLGPLYTPFDEVMATADVITLHCPLMPSTRNMIAAPEFAKMKKRPLLINCGRGGLVNPDPKLRAEFEKAYKALFARTQPGANVQFVALRL